MEQFAGRVAIVTGAGSGIGRATALRLAGEGASVVVVDLHDATAASVVDEIVARDGTALAVTGDVSDQATVDRLIDTAVATYGGVDVLINNAGVMDDMSGPHEVSDATWERVLRVNLTARFLLMRAVVPHMMAKGRGGDRQHRLGGRTAR